jgi:FAD/FMN-containing dehydrogenase
MASGTDLDDTVLDGLRRGFSGELIPPADATYAEHRKVWNGSIDRRPALIARCATPEDVAAAIAFGRERDLPIAVRGGGHSFPGLSVCDDGLVVDLSLMKAITVDPAAKLATVGGGALLGELDEATQEHGLAVPSGIVTHTGVAGLTLGGGIGWIQRRHGLSVDKLESVGVVTADGEQVTASEDENDDLFWGVRGGGGNFGVVTSFRFRAVELGPEVVAGPIFWPIEKSPAVLRFYREWIAEAPDDLMTIVLHRKAPPLPFVPSELHGKLVVAVACCWAGDVEEGERFIAPLKAFESPVLDVCRRKPFLEHQRMFDPSFVPGWWYYMRACDVAELSDEVIDIAVEHSMRIRSPLTSFPIWQMGGAVARVDDDATPFNGRGAGHTFNLTSMVEGPEGFEEERQWVRDFWDALAPYHQGVYVNFLMDEGEERVREAYGPTKYDRLKALKRKYDPENVFALNQNIRPD